MKVARKSFCTCIVFFLIFSVVLAEIEWNSSNSDSYWDDVQSAFVLPDSNETYFIDETLTLSENAIVNGTLEIRNLGILTIAGTNGTAGGNGGPNGTNGEDRSLTNNKTVIVKSGGTINITGKNGGAGGRGFFSTSGGDGGNGGNAQIIGSGETSVEDGGTINIDGGHGGVGGKGGDDDATGGHGGSGGFAKLSNTTALILVGNNSSINVTGGNGGNAGDGGDAEIILNGGDGGNGGNGGLAEISSNSTIIAQNNPLIVITGGNGGNGGDEGSNDGSVRGGLGGSGGTGGNSVLPKTILSTGSVATNSLDASVFTHGSSGSSGLSSGGHAGTGGTYNLNEEITAQRETQPLYDPNLTLSQQLTIDFTWAITQNQNIWGSGNTISLGTNGEIVISDNVTFYLDNLDIEGIAGTNVRCLGESSQLELNDVNWTQSNNCTFTQGKINIYGDNTVTGAWRTFSFQSSQPLTLFANASLTFEAHTTFEYDTSPPTRFVLTNAGCIIGLNDATLVAAQNLTLQNGTLLTDGLSVVEGTGTLSLVGLDDIIVRGALTRVGNVIS